MAATLVSEPVSELEAPAIALPDIDLPAEDGIPLESNWHRIQMNLLIDSVHHLWGEQHQDYFTGGNMFIYFSLEQARNRDYRGPDFFAVKDVPPGDRDSWVVWQEGGRYPDVIVELSSPSTLDVDLGVKLRLYERTFRTPEYYCYNPDGHELLGWRLVGSRYEAIEPDENGWLSSEQLGVWLGNWEGVFQHIQATWLRFYTDTGELMLTDGEAAAVRAEAEAARAEAEAARAAAAEAEVARLKALLGK